MEEILLLVYFVILFLYFISCVNSFFSVPLIHLALLTRGYTLQLVSSHWMDENLQDFIGQSQNISETNKWFFCEAYTELARS